MADFQLIFVFKRSKLHVAPDDLSGLPAFNSISTVTDQQALNEAVFIAQQNSRDLELLNFKKLVASGTFGFLQSNGLDVKNTGSSQCIVLPEDAS